MASGLSISLIALLSLLLACAEPTSRVQAVDDGKIALGMMLVENNGKVKLILAACDPERQCVNALQNSDDTPYYFAALEEPELRRKLRTRGMLKLSTTIAGVAGLTALGLVGIRHVDKLAKLLRIDPSSVTANTSAATIAIAVLTSFSIKIGNYTWGKEERMLTKYWDDIFVVHANFDNPKLINTPVINLIKTLATELQAKVNPTILPAQER